MLLSLGKILEPKETLPSTLELKSFANEPFALISLMAGMCYCIYSTGNRSLFVLKRGQLGQNSELDPRLNMGVD